MKNINEYIQYSSRCIEDPVFQQSMLNKSYQNNINCYSYIYNNNIEQFNIHTPEHNINLNNNICDDDVNMNNINNNEKQLNLKCYLQKNINSHIIKNQQSCLLKPQRNERHVDYSNSFKPIDIIKQNKIKKNKKKPLVIDKNAVISMVQFNKTLNNLEIRSVPSYSDNIDYSNTLNINNNNNCYYKSKSGICSSSNTFYLKDQQYCINPLLNTTNFKGNYVKSMQGNNIQSYIVNPNYNNVMNHDLNNNNNSNDYMQSLIQFGCFNANCNFMGASRQYCNMNNYNKINGMIDYDNEALIKQFDEDMKKINSKFLSIFCIRIFIY